MRQCLVLVLAVLCVGFSVSALSAGERPGTIYGYTMKDIDGNMVSLSKYKGKVVLIVNVASKCGHTPQYAGLEKLYEKYKDQGFVILGFPCNQFKEQEPGSDADIKAFCSAKYNVTFPLFDKIEVNGDHAALLYQFLKSDEPQADGKLDIGWNFTKFLIDRHGHPIKRIMTKVEPEDFDADIAAAVSQ